MNTAVTLKYSILTMVAIQAFRYRGYFVAAGRLFGLNRRIRRNQAFQAR